MQNWFDEEVNDALIDESIKVIKSMMSTFNCSFEVAFETAKVNSNIAPAVLEAFGVQPAQA